MNITSSKEASVKILANYNSLKPFLSRAEVDINREIDAAILRRKPHAEYTWQFQATAMVLNYEEQNQAISKLIEYNLKQAGYTVRVESQDSPVRSTKFTITWNPFETENERLQQIIQLFKQ